MTNLHLSLFLIGVPIGLITCVQLLPIPHIVFEGNYRPNRCFRGSGIELIKSPAFQKSYSSNIGPSGGPIYEVWQQFLLPTCTSWSHDIRTKKISKIHQELAEVELSEVRLHNFRRTLYIFTMSSSLWARCNMCSVSRKLCPASRVLYTRRQCGSARVKCPID